MCAVVAVFIFKCVCVRERERERERACLQLYLEIIWPRVGEKNKKDSDVFYYPDMGDRVCR